MPLGFQGCSEKTSLTPHTSQDQIESDIINFRALHDLALPYLKAIFTIIESKRNTIQSSVGIRLVEPRSKLKFGGDRALSVCAPRL